MKSDKFAHIEHARETLPEHAAALAEQGARVSQQYEQTFDARRQSRPVLRGQAE